MEDIFKKSHSVLKQGKTFVLDRLSSLCQALASSPGILFYQAAPCLVTQRFIFTKVTAPPTVPSKGAEELTGDEASQALLSCLAYQLGTNPCTDKSSYRPPSPQKLNRPTPAPSPQKPNRPTIPLPSKVKSSYPAASPQKSNHSTPAPSPQKSNRPTAPLSSKVKSSYTRPLPSKVKSSYPAPLPSKVKSSYPRSLSPPLKSQIVHPFL